jgi:predicted DCC family thiol-disulfide oxidoreductase YuxK
MVPATLLYDAGCGACTWLVARILAWDRRRRLRPVALQDPEAGLLLGDMEEAKRMASWHLVSPDGAIRSGGAALAPLFRALPAGWPLAALADRYPRLIDLGYRWVASHRAELGRPLPATWKRRARDRVTTRQHEMARAATGAAAAHAP